MERLVRSFHISHHKTLKYAEKQCALRLDLKLVNKSPLLSIPMYLPIILRMSLFLKKYLFFYLVVPGLSCGRQAP